MEFGVLESVILIHLIHIFHSQSFIMVQFHLYQMDMQLLMGFIDINNNDLTWKLYSNPNVTLKSGDGSSGTIICNENNTLKNANYVKFCLSDYNGGRNSNVVIIDRSNNKNVTCSKIESWSNNGDYSTQLSLIVTSGGLCQGTFNCYGWSFTLAVSSIYYI